ncbi:hypothetical protein ACHBHL_05525 [Streptococcus sp. A27]|uniref:hypothetical protein n=1 Tax=unclassified Streptococcus TaxID=2608887 RepID=UPI00374DEDA6
MTLQLNYAKTNEYKAIFKKYLDGVIEWRKKVAYDVRPEVIETFRKKLKKETEEANNDYKNKKMTEARHQMEVIEKQFKNTRNTYTDPQAEILRRQDFDLEFSIMDREDIIELLSDEQRNFSNYELKRIQAAYPDDYKIASLLENQQLKRDGQWLEDPFYKEWQQDYSVLFQTKTAGLDIVYFPNNSDNGYTFENLDLFLSSNQHVTALDYHIQKISQLINEIPTVKKADKPAFFKPEPVKKMEFEEFDDRIYRISPNYDVTIRFKYLKERFDDTTTDRWDFTRDDYDAYRHLQFLEKRHDLKLQNDEEYRKQYYAVETAIKYELEQKKVNFNE